MNKKEIAKGNKIIAEFMLSEKFEGFMGSKYGYLCKKPIKKKDFYSSLEYNSSWSWLMTIVDEIENKIHRSVTIASAVEIFWFHSPKKYNFYNQGFKEKRTEFDVIGGKSISIYIGYPLCSPEIIKAETKIEATFTACVEFIKWYNKVVLKTKK